MWISDDFLVQSTHWFESNLHYFKVLHNMSSRELQSSQFDFVFNFWSFNEFSVGIRLPQVFIFQNSNIQLTCPKTQTCLNCCVFSMWPILTIGGIPFSGEALIEEAAPLQTKDMLNRNDQTNEIKISNRYLTASVEYKFEIQDFFSFFELIVCNSMQKLSFEWWINQRRCLAKLGKWTVQCYLFPSD